MLYLILGGVVMAGLMLVAVFLTWSLS